MIPSMEKRYSLPFASWLLLTIIQYHQYDSSDAQGLLCDPRARASFHDAQRCGSDIQPDVNGNLRKDFCGHCLNGGGSAETVKYLPPKGWQVYNPLVKRNSLMRAGLCGDSLSGNRTDGRLNHMLGGFFMPYDTVPIMGVYKAGSTVDFTVQIDSNQYGYIQFYVCNLDECGSGDIDASCFIQKKCYRLERVTKAECEDPDLNSDGFECGPRHGRYPHRWYIPCAEGTRSEPHLVGGSDGTMRFQLPSGVTCKHCVVQWYWLTGNSCNAKGVRGYFKKYRRSVRPMCRRNFGAVMAYRNELPKCANAEVPPVEFWSCSDVQISIDGESLGTVDAP